MRDSQNNNLTSELSTCAVSVCALALCLAPLDEYTFFKAATFVVTAIAVLGVQVFCSLSGQIALGHAAFFAIGAYCVPISTETLHLPVWAVVVTVPVAAIIISRVADLVLRRLDGIAFALGTFVFGIFILQLIRANGLAGLTGGASGLNVNLDYLKSMGSSDRIVYGVSVAAASLISLTVPLVEKGPLGRRFRAARDHERVAKTMGIIAKDYRAILFDVSAVVVAVAGALSAQMTHFVSPDNFGVQLSIMLFVGATIAGNSYRLGTLVGAAFVNLVPVWSSDYSKPFSPAITGAVLLAVLYATPLYFRAKSVFTAKHQQN